MEAATDRRELTGEKAQRIIEAMRSSVARRGISGSTFEHVAREAASQPRAAPLLLRDEGSAARRGGPSRHRAPDRAPGRAAREGEVGRRAACDPRRRPRGLDPERARFLGPALRPVHGGAPEPRIYREVAELFKRTRQHVAEILRRRTPRESSRSPTKSMTSSHCCSRWRTGSPSRCCRTPTAITRQSSPRAPRPPGACLSAELRVTHLTLR